MKPQKRIRACEACHGLKIKCEVPSGDADGTACTRCQRLGLGCVPAPSRLQRNRIAELESQVEALSAALRERDSQTSGLTPADSVSSGGKAPVTPEAYQQTGKSNSAADDVLAFLDSHISREDQERALHAYSHGYKAVWCPANLSSQTLDDARRNSPLLLLTVVAFPMAAEACQNSVTKANVLCNGATDLCARYILVDGAQNQEMVRALLTAAFWHRIPRGEVAGHCHQYSRLAMEMAIDIGLGGPEFPGSPAVYFRRMDGHQDDDSGRTWLACYVCAAMYALNVRRPDRFQWSRQHETSLRRVESNGRPEDRLFCQIVLLIRLCQQVGQQFELSNFNTFYDINSEASQQKIALLTQRFQEWKLSVPQDLLLHPMVQFWSYVFIIYLNEIVLHTPTNKGTFIAPHVAPNLAVTDFAAPPIVTTAAATAMANLIAACQGAIEACEALGADEVLAAPSAVFVPTIMYALRILVQVFITVNGPESTFKESSLVAKEDVRMREYINKVMLLSKGVEAASYIDTYWTGRILGASTWLDAWANDYEVILQRYAEKQEV
ncbi:hypothetical protein CC79DRAFT_862209 [Sarocladium strictum]